MIGITCLAASMQLLRLIATQRSNASSVIFEQFGVAAGQADADIVVQDVDAAPAAMRIRYHRLEFGVPVTSALNAAAVPPWRAIMSTVSCADARS